MKILVTGAAGFIGHHAVCKYCDLGYKVIGIDNINDYYDTELKFDRLKECGIERSKIKSTIPIQSTKFNNYCFLKLDILDEDGIDKLFKIEKFDLVLHLAAQAGVRYSIDNPKTYIKNNVEGLGNILEASKIFKKIYSDDKTISYLSKKLF